MLCYRPGSGSGSWGLFRDLYHIVCELCTVRVFLLRDAPIAQRLVVELHLTLFTVHDPYNR